jgi:hypothetical protein
MRRRVIVITLTLLVSAACAPAPAELPAPAVVTEAAPGGTANADLQAAETEAAMHNAETQAAALPSGTEAAMHAAETQAAAEAMHVAETAQAAEVMHATATAQASAGPPLLTGAFVKEEVSVTGSYTLDPATGALTFSEDFAVVTGPDLFVILSGASDLTVDYQTFSQMVVNSPRLTLAPPSSGASHSPWRSPPPRWSGNHKTPRVF